VALTCLFSSLTTICIFLSSKSLFSFEDEDRVKCYLKTMLSKNFVEAVDPALSIGNWLATFFQSAACKGFHILFLVDFIVTLKSLELSTN